MDNTIEDNFENTAIIVSDGCCVQLGNLQVLDDVTFSINKGKKVSLWKINNKVQFEKNFLFWED